MHPNMLDQIPEFPFNRLRALLDGIEPPGSADPLALSIGEPRHAPPPMLARILAEQAGLWNRYPPIDGTPEFRRAVAGWLCRRYALDAVCADSQVFCSAGSRESLYLAAALAVSEFKSAAKPLALIPNPNYHVYTGAAVMAGVEPFFMPATESTGFLPDLATLDADILERTVIAYLCTPSNPQGAVAGLDTLAAWARAAREHGFLLAVDECYAEIHYGRPPPGILEAAGPGFDNVLAFHSLSKRSNAAGLRSAFVAGGAALVSKFKHLRSYGEASMPMPDGGLGGAVGRRRARGAKPRPLPSQIRLGGGHAGGPLRVLPAGGRVLPVAPRRRRGGSGEEALGRGRFARLAGGLHGSRERRAQSGRALHPLSLG